MSRIRAFRGLRYDPARVDLDRVIVPPYDVIAAEERDRWYEARIPFVRVGSRAVRYELKALEEFIHSQVRKSTSDRGA